MIERAKIDRLYPSRQRGISLYYQIESYICEKIQSGEWEKGMKLPPEPELSAQFGVSRATIRQAVTNLVQRGMLVRKQGSGTYVSRPSAAEDFLNFSFPDSLGGGHELLGVQELAGDDPAVRDLGLAAGDRAVEIKRLRILADGVPAILEKAYLEISLYERIDPRDLNKKLHLILDQEFGFDVTKMKNSLEPVLLRKEEADALQTQPGLPALLVSRLYYTYQQRPLVLNKNLVRADKCCLMNLL